MIRSFDGKTPKTAESAFVSEAAYVIGDVEIGENSGVLPGAIVRGDFASIKIGCNTKDSDDALHLIRCCHPHKVKCFSQNNLGCLY